MRRSSVLHLPVPPVPARRILHLCGEVSHSETVILAESLLALNRESDNPILLVLDSSGGSATGAHTLTAALGLCKVPLVGLVITRAYSAGFEILQGCDLRLALPSSSLGAHFSHLRSGMSHLTNATDAKALADHHARILAFKQAGWKLQVASLSARSGLDPDQVETLLKREPVLSAAEALELGFIDAIVGHSPST